MKKVLIIFFLIILNLSCSEYRLSVKQRLNKLSSFRSEDDFMNLFLDYLTKYKLEKTMIAYETELLKSNSLKGTDVESYEKYFRSLLSYELATSCVGKKIQKKFTKPFFSNTEEFIKYQKNINEKKITPGKEYYLFTSISAGAIPSLQGMEFILHDNYLSLEKRYFYLMLTMPTNICD